MLKKKKKGALKNKHFQKQKVKVLCVAARMKEMCEAHRQLPFEHHPQTTVSASVA